MGKQTLLVSTALAALWAASFPAMAAETPDRADNYDEIVVTAQRRSERLQDVPLTVVSVNAESLQRAGVRSVADLGSVVSGFTNGATGSLSSPALRGVTSTNTLAGAENPIALYVDGIYQSTPLILNSEIPDVARIEVLKGPQGTLFGRNATGGAIQVFTKDPSFQPAMDIKLSLGYYTGDGGSRAAPHTRAQGFATMPLIADKVAVSVAGGYTYTPGYLTNDLNGKRVGETSRSNARAKLLLTPAEGTRVLLSAFYLRDAGGLQTTGAYKGLSAAAAYPGSVVPNRPWHTAYGLLPLEEVYTSLRQYGFSGRVEQDFDIGKVTALVGYTKTKVLNGKSDINFAASTAACYFTFACIYYDYPQHSRETSAELNFASRDFGILSFVAGLYYYNNKGGDTRQIQRLLAPLAPGVFPIVLGVDQFNFKAYAAYAEATVKPTDRLSLIGGVRVSSEPRSEVQPVPVFQAKKKTFKSITPRASIKYDVTDELNAYGTVSVGYRSGLPGLANTAFGQAPIKPEKLYSYEAGLKYANPTASANLSVFYYNYKNKQEQVTLGATTGVINVGKATIFGVDFDGRLRVSDNFSLNVAATYMPKAKYESFPVATGISTNRIPFDPSMPPFNCSPGGACGAFIPVVFDASGQRQLRSPKLTGSFTVAYENGPFDASATVAYSSKVIHIITEDITQKRYATINAQVGYKLSNAVRMSVYGRNLSNHKVINGALSSTAAFGALFGPPREVGVAVGYTY